MAFFEGSRRFALNGANPCDNPHLQLQLFDIAEQHRTDCHESGAVGDDVGIIRRNKLRIKKDQKLESG